MGRFLIILGLLMAVVGGIGTGWSIFSSVTSAFDPSTFTAREDELCNENETLVEETGSSEYRPGISGYSRSVLYYCVDSEGQRRNVTGEFVTGLFGNLGGLFPGISLSLIMGGLMTLGIFLIIIGVVVAITRRNREPIVPANYPSFPPPSGTVGGTLYGMSRTQGYAGQPLQPSVPPSSLYDFGTSEMSAGDLTTRLRQLDEARKANLISEDEYQRLRQQILDSMR